MSAAFCTKSVLLSTLVVLAVSVMIVRAQETLPQAPAEAPPVAAEVGAEEYSYAIGLQIGTGFQSDGVELNVESLMAGVRDGLAQAEPKLDEATLLAALQHLGKVRMESLVGQNEKFLEKNKEAEGVKV